MPPERAASCCGTTTSSSSARDGSRWAASSGAWTVSCVGRTSASKWAAGRSGRSFRSRTLHPHAGRHPAHPAAVLVAPGPSGSAFAAAELLRGDDVIDPEDHVRDLRGGFDRLPLHAEGLDDLRLDHVVGGALLEVHAHVLPPSALVLRSERDE